MSATPGPWEAVLKDDPRGQPVCYYRGLIALVENRLSVVLGPGHAYETVPEEEWEANAKLIAAAPALADMLAHVRGCIAEDDTFLGAVLRVEIDKVLALAGMIP